MFKKLSKTAAIATILTATAAAAAGPANASASSASVTVSKPYIAAHFDLARGQMPENIALAPDGTADVTFAAARQIAEITTGGATRVLATLPAPADGGLNTPVLHFPLTTGIVRDHRGTLYVLYATGTADLTGVWRLRPGGIPERIAALPAGGLPNGLALDPRTHTLYVADSVLGTIWSVATTGGTPKAWSTAPELATTGFLGVNGIKIRHGAVWVTNLDKGTVLRIPLQDHDRAGEIQTRASGLAGIDDFTFTGHGDTILAALNGPNSVALVRPDGTHTTVLSAADGLQNPTSIALHGTTVYVLSAAYTTANDPNLIRARLNH